MEKKIFRFLRQLILSRCRGWFVASRARLVALVALLDVTGPEEKDHHIQKAHDRLQEGEPAGPDYDTPLSEAHLTRQPSYRMDVVCSLEDWCKAYLLDVRWCLMFCHMHKCAPTCYKTRKAMEQMLCRFRYYQAVWVQMLREPDRWEKVVTQGKPLRDEPGSDVDMRVVNSRDHPFISSFHPLLQAAFRSNCDVQALVSSFGPVIDHLQANLDKGYGDGAGLREAAKQLFLHTARNSCVIAHYITTYITKVMATAFPIFDALKRVPIILEKKEAKMQATQSANESGDNSKRAKQSRENEKRKKRDAHFITIKALSRQCVFVSRHCRKTQRHKDTLCLLSKTQCVFVDCRLCLVEKKNIFFFRHHKIFSPKKKIFFWDPRAPGMQIKQEF